MSRVTDAIYDDLITVVNKYAERDDVTEDNMMAMLMAVIVQLAKANPKFTPRAFLAEAVMNAWDHMQEDAMEERQPWRVMQ